MIKLILELKENDKAVTLRCTGEESEPTIYEKRMEKIILDALKDLHERMHSVMNEINEEEQAS